MKAIFESHQIPHQFQDNLRIEFSLFFMTFSASIFASIFSSMFDGSVTKNDSKKHPGNPSKSILFATMSESRLFTLRACPPTLVLAPNLDAPNLHAPSFRYSLQSGTGPRVAQGQRGPRAKGPRAKGPRGQGGP